MKRLLISSPRNPSHSRQLYCIPYASLIEQRGGPENLYTVRGLELMLYMSSSQPWRVSRISAHTHVLFPPS